MTPFVRVLFGNLWCQKLFARLSSNYIIITLSLVMLAAINYTPPYVRNIIGRAYGDIATIGQRLALCVPSLKLNDNR
jgi:hypothetical protein